MHTPPTSACTPTGECSRGIWGRPRPAGGRRPDGVPFVQRRLAPEGVELVRSGAVQPKDWYLVPESAWEDREGRPYVPARYEACFRPTDSPPDVEALLDLLPASAQALLSESDPALNPQCLEVTPEEARSLEEISESSALIPRRFAVCSSAWSLRDGNGDQVGINLHPSSRTAQVCPAGVLSSNSPSRRASRPAPHGEPFVQAWGRGSGSR